VRICLGYFSEVMLVLGLMLHELLRVWFHWVEVWGYAGVFILMAMESSIIPVPSELVIPPAAFWAAQGQMSFAGVILAGTAGSYFGSIVNYWLSLVLGRPMVERYGKYVFLPHEKIQLAERWLKEFGTFGVFIARLLPVVRHLISIPAGLLKMPISPFSLATLFGAGLWCTILAWFGQEIIGSHPDVLHSPEAMMALIKSEMHWIVLACVGLALLYGVVIVYQRKKWAQETPSVNPLK